MSLPTTQDQVQQWADAVAAGVLRFLDELGVPEPARADRPASPVEAAKLQWREAGALVKHLDDETMLSEVAMAFAVEFVAHGVALIPSLPAYPAGSTAKLAATADFVRAQILPSEHGDRAVFDFMFTPKEPPCPTSTE